VKTRHPSPNTDFDSVLEFCLGEIRVGRLTRDECLERYPDLATRLQPLLKVAAVAMAAPSLSMRSAARDALERRLRTRMAELPAPRNVPDRPRLTAMRWASIAAAVVVLAAISSGTIAVAAASLPGDLLYPVKRWSESVALQTTSDATRVYLHLEWAERRLTEFRSLTARGVVDVTLLDEFGAETTAAIAASDALGEPLRIKALSQVAAIHTTAIEVVSSVRDRAPEDVLTGLDGALAALASIRENALRRLPPTPTSGPTATGTSSPTPTPAPILPESTVASESSTPPGQGTSGGGLTKTPPGQGTPGGGLTKTPSGQGTPGSGLTKTPSGQGTPGRGLTKTPSGQGTPGDGPPNPPPKHKPKPTKTPKP